MTKWIIFDMDNTLIDTEPLYLNASARFADLMSYYGISKKEALEKQNEIDANLFKEFGYSTDRFAESFARTVRLFESRIKARLAHPDSDIAILNIIDQVKSFAMAVFNQKSIEYPYAADVVRKFMHTGYNVAVITAGERWVQIRRFDDLTMRNLFHDCWVVLRKDEQVFSDFCAKHNVDIANSWMIGDSLKSDIIPSTNVGLNAIHLQTSNWESRDGKLLVPNGVISVKDLSYTTDIVLGAIKNA